MSRMRPSPAMVVAFIALVVSVTGSAYAAVRITTANIADRAVTHPKLSDNSVWHRNIGFRSVRNRNMAANSVWHAQIGQGSVRRNNINAQLLSELKGAKGPQGPAGPAGPQGPSGVANVTADGPYPGVSQLQNGLNSTSKWKNDGTLQTSWVRCPAGDVALGGGFGPNGDNTTAFQSGSVEIIGSAPNEILGNGSNSDPSNLNVALGGTPQPVNPDHSFKPNGWAVQGYNHSGSDVVVRPWVVCAPG